MSKLATIVPKSLKGTSVGLQFGLEQYGLEAWSYKVVYLLITFFLARIIYLGFHRCMYCNASSWGLIIDIASLKCIYRRSQVLKVLS